MPEIIVCCIPRSEAVRHAARYLSSLGLTVTEKPEPDVTHLLLPVPSFPNGDEYLAHILSGLPENIRVFGGNLASPLLKRYSTVDFLKDPYYLADNAAITADCAIQIAENKTDVANCSVLVLGWGRIGKCLGAKLSARGADVTIAARKDADLAMIHALGYHAVPISRISEELHHYRIILNTVPEMILPEINTHPEAVILELASKPGMSGNNIISARGLPGKMAPAASGKLIAETFIRLL